jgi:hypothetical protein
MAGYSRIIASSSEKIVGANREINRPAYNYSTLSVPECDCSASLLAGLSVTS